MTRTRWASVVTAWAALAAGAPPLAAANGEAEPPVARGPASPPAAGQPADDPAAVVAAGVPLPGGGGLSVALRAIPTGDPRRAPGVLRGHEQGESAQHQADLLPPSRLKRSAELDGPAPRPADEGAGPATRAPGSWLRNFEGTPSSGWIPPDPVIAAGPKYLVEVVNSGFEICSKDGDRDRDYTDLEAFFAPLYPVLPEPWSGNAFVFDPRVVYEPVHGQFVLHALGRDDSNLRSYIFFAISVTDDPLGD